jgi:hypothetical protein
MGGSFYLGRELMRGGCLTTGTSLVNLAKRAAASLGEGESCTIGATAPAIRVDVPYRGDNGGDSWSAVH